MNEFMKFTRSRQGLILFMDLIALVQKDESIYAVIGVKERTDNTSPPSWSSREILVNINFTPQYFIDVCKVNKIKCSVYAGESIERYILETPQW